MIKLPKNKREAVKASLKKLENGEFDTLNIKDMVGDWKGYRRFRAGNMRIIFWQDNEKGTIYVDYIGARGDVYKKQG